MGIGWRDMGMGEAVSVSLVKSWSGGSVGFGCM